jgi:hypothetical protein
MFRRTNFSTNCIITSPMISNIASAFNKFLWFVFVSYVRLAFLLQHSYTQLFNITTILCWCNFGYFQNVAIDKLDDSTGLSYTWFDFMAVFFLRSSLFLDLHIPFDFNQFCKNSFLYFCSWADEVHASIDSVCGSLPTFTSYKYF